MAFPCNQFGAQEPGTNAEIQEFANSKYQVNFPMFAKIEVNGEQAAPLYRFLREAAPEDDGSTDITWNFAKFLVNERGEVIKRFSPKTTPEEIGAVLDALLKN